MGEAREQPHAGHRARLRQRFELAGFDGFAEHEKVELLLTLCIPRRDVKQPARDLLKRFGSLRGILDARLEDLRAIEGIGEVTPVALRIIREASALYLQQKAEVGTLLDSTDAIEDFWRARLGGLRHEVFEVAYLDTSYRLMRDGIERLEEGVHNRTYVYPRKVMSAALQRGAAILIMAHNHPAAPPEPSRHDRDLTTALLQAAKPLQIRIHDHLVVARDGVFSFRRHGLMKAG